jgi:hypothetical protein
MPLPAIAELRELFEYDPDTGILRWKVRPRHHFKNEGAWKAWNTRYAGSITGCSDKLGYLRTNIRGTPHLTHRLIWALHYGEWVDYIDHENRVPGDNRIKNLRAATSSQNQHNLAASSHNKSGFKGVSWHKATRKWRATIFVNWKQTYLGLFATAEEAYAAYCKAAAELHGDFANVGTTVANTESA